MTMGTASFQIARVTAAILLAVFCWAQAFVLGFLLFATLFSPGTYSYVGLVLRTLFVNGVPGALVLWGFVSLRRKYGRSLLLLAACVGVVFGFLSNFVSIIVMPILK